MRTLCLGIGSEKSAKYHYSSLNRQEYPTISDYDLVIVNLNDLAPPFNSFFARTREEFKKFFENRGVCFVILTARNLSEDSRVSNFEWCPFSEKMRIQNKQGETVICKLKKAQFFFDQIEFYWNCFFSAISPDVTVVATNRTHDPISVIVPYESGSCVFLPSTDKDNELLNLLIEKGLNIIPEIERGSASSGVPSWASSLMSETELDLLESMNQIGGRLGKYNRFKALLWESGEALQNLVVNAFEEVGIEVTKLPKESHADFEIHLDRNLTGVCEVKGLLGDANIQDLRQLLDYFIDQRDIEKRNVKGIFIVNHHRNEEPSKRGNPVTRDASDLMKKYGFALLTATQLYGYLTKYWQGQFTKEDILRSLGSQS
jgi:hypothetical protein